MPNKGKLICPNCGSEQYVVNHAGGSTSTFLMCKTCGKKGTEEAWKVQKNIMHDNGDSFDIKSFNLSKIKMATNSIGDSNQLASDQPSDENNPQLAFKRNKNKGKRTRIDSDGSEADQDKRYNSEVVTPASISGDMNKMAFNLKKIKANKNECNCLSKHAHVAHEDMCDECKDISKKSANKPFNMMKIAREFKYTDEQLARKELNKNVVFPEGRQDLDSKKTKGKGGDSEQDKYIGVEENRRFDSIDRKDAHTPDPKQMIPGYKEWYDREVDQYYDGWLDDHIENSGGKVVGSNTEKTMNLNNGERYHAPKFPVEASYEKLLESRHNFNDDYKRKIAFNLSKITQAKKKI